MRVNFPPRNDIWSGHHIHDPLRDDDDLFRALAVQGPYYRIEGQNGSLNIGISGAPGHRDVARDAGNADIEAAVLALDAVIRALDGKRPKKVIVVPQRIVNVVA